MMLFLFVAVAVVVVDDDNGSVEDTTLFDVVQGVRRCINVDALLVVDVADLTASTVSNGVVTLVGDTRPVFEIVFVVVVVEEEESSPSNDTAAGMSTEVTVNTDDASHRFLAFFLLVVVRR
jgi:hypothetical protein